MASTHWFTRPLVALGATTGLLAGVIGLAPVAAAAGTSHTLRVGCGPRSYATIGDAVTAASSGGRIVVCSGIYHEHVVIPADKRLTITGRRHRRGRAHPAG